MKNETRILWLGICLLAALTAWAGAHTDALANRPAADRERDAGRKPAEVLAFAGVAPGMTVMDVMAASGWYTEVLSAAVGPEGVVYSENPRWLLNAMNGAPDKALTERLEGGRLINVVRADAGLEDGLIPAGSVDVALTALNYHDTYYMSGEAAAAAQMRAVYQALKPGGVFILIDHAGKAGMDNAKLHRMEQATAEALARDAGFTVDARGQMLRNPDDDLSKMVFAKDLRGKTDRFVLKLRKPA